MTTQSAGSTAARSRSTFTTSQGGRAPRISPTEYPHHVLIGRFQGLTRAHADLISQSFGLGAKKLTILVGSASTARNPRNPLRFPERKVMLENMLRSAKDPNVRAAFNDGVITILPLSDRTYDNQGWAASVQEQIRQSLLMTSDSTKTRTAIIGYHKDPSTSFYLNMFGALYGQINANPYEVNGQTLDASAIREMLFRAADPYALLTKVAGIGAWLPDSVIEDLRLFIDRSPPYLLGMTAWDYLKTEYDAIAAMKAKWVPPRLSEEIPPEILLQLPPEVRAKLDWKLPYPVSFQCADPVVIQSGHILLVRRGVWPGKGLLAFPGGHLEMGETHLQCMLRELYEETGIELPESVILGSLKAEFLFDDPHRSLRGRYVSQGFGIELNPRPELPKIKGGDDAAEALWQQISEVAEEDMFEDHYHGQVKLRGLMGAMR